MTIILPLEIGAPSDSALMKDRIISTYYKSPDEDFIPIRVRDDPDSGRLECQYHAQQGYCTCIDLVISNHLDAELLQTVNFTFLPLMIPDTSPIIIEHVGIRFSEERITGGGRLATGPNGVNLGYQMPYEGRYSLLNAFLVVCQDYLATLRKMTSESIRDLCRHPDHNYLANAAMLVKLGSDDSGVIEAGFLLDSGIIEAGFLLLGICTFCTMKSSYSPSNDVPYVG
jgi:hypothetical protein